MLKEVLPLCDGCKDDSTFQYILFRKVYTHCDNCKGLVKLEEWTGCEIVVPKVNLNCLADPIYVRSN